MDYSDTSTYLIRVHGAVPTGNSAYVQFSVTQSHSSGTISTFTVVGEDS